MYKLAIILLVVSTACTTVVFASDSLVTWNGEVRVRGEVDGRDFMHRTPPNLYTFLRTRIGAEVMPVKDVGVFIQLQDSRMFGQPLVPGASNTNVNGKNIDLHQGYLVVSDFLVPDLSVKFGRMELAYGDGRIVGVNDWGNVGRVFDGALFRYSADGHAADLFVTDVVEYSLSPIPVSRSSVASLGSEGFLFSGVHYSNAVLRDHLFDLYGFHEWSHSSASTSEVDRSRFTLGGRLRGETSGFTYSGEGAYQLGTQDMVDISAFMLVGALGYVSDDFFVSSVTGGADYLSGTSTGSSKIRTFDPVFHSSHPTYGVLDYFTDIPTQTFGRGLLDVYLRIVLQPLDELSISIEGHDFRLTKEYVGRKKLGREISLVGTLAYNAAVIFETGAGVFLPDEIMEFEIGGSDPGWWGYGTVRVRF